MDSHERRIVTFLSRPTAYPHPTTGGIIRRETHVSHVFLAGRFAYKLKKPVKFPFLDASTLPLRRKFCLLELSLNRRLAPSVYLGLVAVVKTPTGLRLGGKGRVVEWLVKMRRLPEDRMLDQLVVRGKVSRKDVEPIADRLVSFFRHARHSRKINRFGFPDQVASLVLGNLSECRLFVGKLLAETDRRFLESAYRQFLALHEPVLAERVKKNRIIDGHGDLRCENICLGKPISIFDCVEFEPAFRCADMANDFAFLVMDLEFRRRFDLAEVLASRYRRVMRDSTFDQVLDFYKCHRSLVRGKVRGFAWLQHPGTKKGKRLQALSKDHFRLAVRYAKAFAPPRLVVVGGTIGTGKSALAKALAEKLAASWLRSDEIRLKGFTRYRKEHSGFAEGIYDPRVSDMVYQRLIEHAEKLVRAGHSVVCDGTFSKKKGRHALRRIAKRWGASFHFFECTVPRAVALKRIARRFAAKTDISEARPEHYERLRTGFEPVKGWSAKDWTKISDNRPAAATCRAAIRVLQRVWA